MSLTLSEASAFVRATLEESCGSWKRPLRLAKTLGGVLSHLGEFVHDSKGRLYYKRLGESTPWMVKPSGHFGDFLVRVTGLPTRSGVLRDALQVLIADVELTPALAGTDQAATHGH